MKEVSLSRSGEIVFINLYGKKDLKWSLNGGSIGLVPEKDYTSFMKMVREEEYACNLRCLTNLVHTSPIYPWSTFSIEGHSLHRCTCRACMCGIPYDSELFNDEIVWSRAEE